MSWWNISTKRLTWSSKQLVLPEQERYERTLSSGSIDAAFVCLRGEILAVAEGKEMSLKSLSVPTVEVEDFAKLKALPRFVKSLKVSFESAAFDIASQIIKGIVD